MLSQIFQRQDAKAQGRKEDLLIIFAPWRPGVLAFLLFFISCSSPPTDMRSLAPAETLVYLETGDLAKTLGALTASPAFGEAARSTPDFSALENVQFAVAVIGFEASEKHLTNENSALDFKPHFTVLIDTHAWNWQALSLTENQIGNFVRSTYGDDVRLEKSDRGGGKWFAWTAKDESRVFAFVEGGRIFFGNDAAAVEKCLAVKNGEAESLLKNEFLSRAHAALSAEKLAFGYVSPEGVAQISNLAGVSVASGASEEAAGQSFIARVLPQIMRGTMREVVWSANASGNKIEDVLSISLAPETASVLTETLAANAENQTSSAEFLPAELFSATRYNLKNPLIAWRSLLLVSAKNADPASAGILIDFSDKLLESYGVADAEAFLGSVGSDLLTARLDREGEKSVVVATVKNAENLKKSLSGEIDFKLPPEKISGADLWRSADKLTSAAFAENKLILGETEAVLKCLEAKTGGRNFTKSPGFQRFAESRAVAVTYARDADSTEKVVEALSEPKDENKKIVTGYLTETRVNVKGIERRTVSDFGFIGTIIEQMEE